MTETTAATNDATTDVQATDDDRLDAETAVVWKEDPEQYDYVRERVALARSADGDLPKRVGRGRRIIGYTEVGEDGPTVHAGMHPRRVFYLTPDDRARGEAFAEKAPSEAVDPRTVRVGERGEVTERVQGEA
jgi:hypothetical protein